MSRSLAKALALLVVALAVPVVPFLLLGEAFEARAEAWLREMLFGPWGALAVAGLLGVDFLLPIPSSVVSTLAGKALGFWAATLASWIGMTAGAAAAFALARLAGRPLARRLAGPDELERMDRSSERLGATVLIVARPVPVLAEASVLLFGAARLGWTRFLAAVAPTNLGIAAAYAALGERVELPYALALAIALPLAAVVFARRRLGLSREPSRERRLSASSAGLEDRQHDQRGKHEQQQLGTSRDQEEHDRQRRPEP